MEVMSLSVVAVSNSADCTWEEFGAIVINNMAQSAFILVDANGELAIPAPLPPIRGADVGTSNFAESLRIRVVRANLSGVQPVWPLA